MRYFDLKKILLKRLKNKGPSYGCKRWENEDEQHLRYLLITTRFPEAYKQSPPKSTTIRMARKELEAKKPGQTYQDKLDGPESELSQKLSNISLTQQLMEPNDCNGEINMKNNI
jgi:hypothetical protein